MEKKKVIVNGKKIYVKGEALDLSSKGITDISEIEGLESHTNLQELSLFGNQITTVRGLNTLANLQILSLYGNQITALKKSAKARKSCYLSSLHRPSYQHAISYV